MPPRSTPNPHILGAVLWALLLTLAAGSFAQGFDPQRYYQQCLAFESGGDLETARHSCLNAIAADPGFDLARLAVARIELALGNLPAAESQLEQARRSSDETEYRLLLAEVYIESSRYGEAESELLAARSEVSAAGPELRSRHSYLLGEMERRSGQFSEALDRFRSAVRAQPSSLQYTLALASLLFEVGELDEARAVLESHVAQFGDPQEAGVNSLLGWTLWAQGDLGRAAQELERAMSLRGAGFGAAQARDLRALGLVYYGLGEVQAGGLAFREAAARGNLFETFLSGNLTWVLLLLLIVALHLIGESRVGGQPLEQGDDSDYATLWSVGTVYRIAGVALLLSLPLAMAYGVARYGNLLAMFTPVQDGDTRAVLFITFSLVVAWGAWRSAARNGWQPKTALLGTIGRPSQESGAAKGVLLGLLMLAATFVYRAYLPEWEWLGNHFLDLAHLTTAAAVALLVIPLSEIYFRSFAFPAFERRYGPEMAIIISAVLSALIFTTPAPLLLGIGLVLATVYRGSRNGALTFTAMATLHWGLLLAVLTLPLARSLFL